MARARPTVTAIRDMETLEPRAPCRVTPPTRLVAGSLLGLALAACAPVRLDVPVELAPSGTAGPARFDVRRDIFAFPNLVRANHPGRTDLFANYCILMARGASQFFRFARFDPDAPPVPADAYVRLVREVLDVAPWALPRPPTERVIIPGYPDLHTFSRAHEATMKAAFGSQIPSMWHWRNWRVGLPVGPGHQVRVAEELLREVEAGRPAPVMITNFPDPDLLNHVVLVYDRRVRSGVVEFLAYDPNDPGNPLGLHFDPATRGFWIGSVPYGPPGRIRAFRLYTSPLL